MTHDNADDDSTATPDTTDAPGTSRRGFLAGATAAGAAAVGLGSLPSSAAASTDGSQHFRVRIENVSTPNTLDTSEGSVAVPLSPGAYAVHDASAALFETGEAASPGLEDVAEDGVPTTLVGELSGTEGVHDAGAFAGAQTATDPNQPAGGPQPPIFHGGAYEFTVTADVGDSLSFATMFIQSNDLFYAPNPDGIGLFENGEPVSRDVTDQLALWDASTEVDQEPGVGGDQAPRQSSRDTGAADDNSSTVKRVSDVNAEGYDYPETAEVIRVKVRPFGLSEPLPGASDVPANLDDDPLLEDVDGNGEGDIFDAITYYNNRDSNVVQGNPRQFDFDGDGESGTLFDAIELYNKLTR